MEIKVNVTEEIIQNAVQKAVIEALERGYSNPIKDAVDFEMKNQEGVIKQLVSKIISEAISKPECQEALKDAVMQKLVSKILI